MGSAHTTDTFCNNYALYSPSSLYRFFASDAFCGVNSSIYRLGNLAFMVQNGRVQHNLADHAFTNKVQASIKLQCIAKEIGNAEISPVDDAAKAIVRLFDKTFTNNEVYHIFNPYLFDMTKTLYSTCAVHTVSIQGFIDKMTDCLKSNPNDHCVTKFIACQGWLYEHTSEYIMPIKVLQNKTQTMLKAVNAEWTPITNEIFNKYLKSLKHYDIAKSSIATTYDDDIYAW